MTGVTQKIADIKANDRQVGGDHYHTSDKGLQHWDLFGLDYLIGYATKYMRWRKKGGVEDLEKAIHVIEKIKEVLATPPSKTFPHYDADQVEQWARGADLDWAERIVVMNIMYARLDDAIEGIRYLIDRAPPHRVGDSPLIVHAAEDGSVNVKKFRDMSIDELRQIHGDYVSKNAATAGWGAAVGARQERIKEIELEIQRRMVDQDESHHSSTYPWQIRIHQWNAIQVDRRELLRPFYVQRGELYILEAAVATWKLPRELVSCYSMIDGIWVMNVDRIPESLRDNYPRLPLEQNSVERDQLPEWQRCLYEWHGDEESGKWLLKSSRRAWGPEI